ncbi:MAG: hypothetical protein ACR2QC_11980 [Gammaproteobacteria bacterium]
MNRLREISVCVNEDFAKRLQEICDQEGKLTLAAAVAQLAKEAIDARNKMQRDNYQRVPGRAVLAAMRACRNSSEEDWLSDVHLFYEKLGFEFDPEVECECIHGGEKGHVSTCGYVKKPLRDDHAT